MKEVLKAGNPLGEQILTIMRQRGIPTMTGFADLLHQYPGFEKVNISTLYRWVSNKKLPKTRMANLAVLMLTASHPGVLSKAVLEKEFSLLEQRARRIAHEAIELRLSVERIRKSLGTQPEPPAE